MLAVRLTMCRSGPAAGRIQLLKMAAPAGNHSAQEQPNNRHLSQFVIATG